MNKVKKRNAVFVNAALFLLASAYVILYCKGTSILYNTYGYDSTIFMYEGAGMTHGLVPYKDVFELKGPMLFFIQWLGQVICPGRLGGCIIELINFNVIVFFTYYTAKLFVSSKKSFTITVSLLLFWCACLINGNAVEEYAMGFTMPALYIFAKDLKKNDFANRWHYFLYGILAMGSCLTRLTECVIVGGCLIYIFVAYLVSKNFKEVPVLIGIVLSGCIVVLTPFLVYFGYHGALYDMLDGMLLFSLKYASFNRGSLSIWKLLILLFPAIMAILEIKRHMLAKICLLLTGMCFLLCIVTGATYEHYLIVAIPCVLLGLIMAFERISWKENKRAFCALAALFVLCNLWTIDKGCRGAGRQLRSLTGHDAASVSAPATFAEGAAPRIKPEYWNSVYYFEAPPEIAFITDTYSSSCFFATQGLLGKDPEMKERIYQSFLDADSQYAVTLKSILNASPSEQDENIDDRIVDVLRTSYEEIYSFDDYVLLEKVG